jgi:quercetin dioxygenase-like cupin family protein
MKVFDISDMKAFGYEQRAMNVIHEAPEFKLRVIELAPGGNIPLCEMASHVVFVCFEGEATVTIDGEETVLTHAKGLVTKPARVSMKSEKGAKLMGIQITSSTTG